MDGVLHRGAVHADTGGAVEGVKDGLLDGVEGCIVAGGLRAGRGGGRGQG